MAVKGHVVADFITEFTTLPNSLPLVDDTMNNWILNVDGSSTEQLSGAGIILVTLDGHKVEYALWFRFPATNNEAEYEALIAGIWITR